MRLRELCLMVLLAAASGCAGGYALTPSRDLTTAGITWQAPLDARDGRSLARWRAAVGSPLVLPGTSASHMGLTADGLTIISWNVALDGGDIMRAVREVQADAPDRPIVLLAQEAFRSGDDIPPSPVNATYAGFLGGSRRDREIDDVARALDFALYYVPSMRNGAPGVHQEDRGNAILSNLPLEDLVAFELPFERQRRVAVAARVRGTTSDGRAWSLRLASVHLDNAGSIRRGWIGAEFARVRQTRALREALRGEDPLVLAGDFNTWFGFSDQAYVETARDFPQTRVTDTRRTFRGLLRLDHLFYRLPDGWTARVRRAESAFGSDHHPLIASVHF